MPAWFHNLRREVTGQAHQLAERGLLLSGVPRPQALLVLGHMRSGSTLLLHLLMTHPQIAAVGERNAVYRRR
ncbi:MAG TPA: sulfotransferase, partial [Steroidobacteraceae bacterium]|nr:sulfotransferase [Steroidobacteraceae bacterium]